MGFSSVEHTFQMGFWAAKLIYIYTISYLSSEGANTFWCSQKAASPNPSQKLSSASWCSMWAHAATLCQAAALPPRSPAKRDPRSEFHILFRLKDLTSLLSRDLPRQKKDLPLGFCAPRLWCSRVHKRVSANLGFRTHIQGWNELSLFPLLH